MKPVADPKGGVVLLHGLGRTGRSMASIAAALKRKSYSTFAPSYGSPWLSMAGIIDQLRPRIDRFAAETDGPLHFVTHSLGGLVARALIASHPPQKLARVVMLAPPNRGSELADILFRLRLNRLVLGPVGPQLRTARPRSTRNCWDGSTTISGSSQAIARLPQSLLGFCFLIRMMAKCRWLQHACATCAIMWSCP